MKFYILIAREEEEEAHFFVFFCTEEVKKEYQERAQCTLVKGNRQPLSIHSLMYRLPLTDR